MKTQNFLFELGCEELPPKALTKLAQGLKDQVANKLKLARLTFENITTFATPRRLAILVTNLASHQPSQRFVRQGPSVDKAFDKNGTPTLACIGFARSCGVSADQLKTKETEKGKRIYCEIEQPGQTSASLLPDIIAAAIDSLPVGKPMRWGSSEKPFIRPVKWVVMMLDNEVIPAEYFGVTTGANTYGHRFHHPEALKLTTATDYEKLLEKEGFVCPDFNQRKMKIIEQINKESSAYGKALIDENLLNEVTALVEYPVVLIGQFSHSFLQVPSEALITAMKVHQKCFPLVDTNNNLMPYFVLVSNIQSKAPQKVIEGNERVIHARLSDATFFFEKDKQHSLEHFTKKLSQVVFQKSLGTLQDRVDRLMNISTHIANEIGIDRSSVTRAAQLAKFDLMTEMVIEFPELQGIMGYHYAKLAGVPDEIAMAIKEHYYPRFSGDNLPQHKLSAALALADRLDLIVGILGINKIPTGEKDPYALKRAAQGIIRILIENKLPLDLKHLLETTAKQFKILSTKTTAEKSAFIEQCYQFIMDRMRSWYLEQGVSAALFAAVLATHPTVPYDFARRIHAVQKFQHLPESSSLAAANKRVSNILKKSTRETSTQKIDETLFESDTERKLAQLLQEKATSVNHLYDRADYTEALLALATLKEPVDRFFDEVMIMVEDEKVRHNRLALLRKLHHLFTQVADISLLPS